MRASLNALIQRGGTMSRELLATFSKTLVTQYVDRNGVKRFVGKPNELKQSQLLDYPTGRVLAVL